MLLCSVEKIDEQMIGNLLIDTADGHDANFIIIKSPGHDIVVCDVKYFRYSFHVHVIPGQYKRDNEQNYNACTNYWHTNSPSIRA